MAVHVDGILIWDPLVQPLLTIMIQEEAPAPLNAP